MDILFGRNKKEQLEPVRARVTGEHFVKSTVGPSYIFRCPLFFFLVYKSNAYCKLFLENLENGV